MSVMARVREVDGFEVVTILKWHLAPEPFDPVEGVSAKEGELNRY
jgi:hypothetical protein